MPAFGLSGPWRDNVGFAQTMEQVTGMAWITGHRDDQPRIQQGPSDPNAGMHAAFALIVGLAERDALASMARSEAGKLVGHVVRVEFAPIELTVGQTGEHGTVTLEAGNLVRIRTRSLCAGDHICGNEEIY